MVRSITARVGLILAVAACLAVAWDSPRAAAQDGSLMQTQPVPQRPLSIEEGSFMFRELPPEARASELKEHDIITVIVDYRTRMLSEGDAESRVTKNLTAVLSSWVRFDGKNLKPAAQSDGDPRVAGTYNSQSRTESDVELRDTLNFRIGAQIIEIRPNGNLYIEANWSIQNNEERWRIFLSGEVRRESIMPDRTVSSDAIVNLDIVKKEEGQVRDGYARGWFAAWYDKYKPF
jgi:flagellar L-ring protein precursor FlgH